MSAGKAPAPVNLKRLYICVLAVTMAAGLVSLGMLTFSSSRIETLQRSHGSAVVWIDSMTSALEEDRTAFHKSLNPPGALPLPAGRLEDLAARMADEGLPFKDSFPGDVVKGVKRLSGLSRIKEDAVRRGHWEDLQVAVRDFEKASDDLQLLLHEEKERIRKFMDREEAGNRGRMRLTGVILGMSLLLAIVISIGIYLNWRRFERAVLGLEDTPDSRLRDRS